LGKGKKRFQDDKIKTANDRQKNKARQPLIPTNQGVSLGKRPHY
jgi:hypothetical protein